MKIKNTKEGHRKTVNENEKAQKTHEETNRK